MTVDCVPIMDHCTEWSCTTVNRKHIVSCELQPITKPQIATCMPGENFVLQNYPW